MDTNKQAALERALEQINAGGIKRTVNVKMCGNQDAPPLGLQGEIESLLGYPVSITWSQVTKREIPRTNNGEITDGISAEQRYYEEAARRGARTGD